MANKIERKLGMAANKATGFDTDADTVCVHNHNVFPFNGTSCRGGHCGFGWSKTLPLLDARLAFRQRVGKNSLCERTASHR